MPVIAVLNRFKHLVVFCAALVVWLLLGMVVLDSFVPPLEFLRLKLMPWHAMKLVPAFATLDERLNFMQGLLLDSERVARISFIVMLASFVLFSVNLTVLYQQRKRRVRENELLLIKNQEIARRNEFIRYISATIGHEFKNNLGRIKRRLDLFPDLPDELRERIGGNFEKLFADIDIFKKISEERESRLADFQRVDLREMLLSISGQYADIASISIVDGESPPQIFASPALLMTVFENLVDNSVKYKKPGQDLARVSIMFSQEFDGRRGYVTISVRDEGKGMDEQQIDQCFYKGRGDAGGWGEGLYFVKYVIGLHAGKVRVGKDYTAPSKGTEIILSLPLVKEELSV